MRVGLAALFLASARLGVLPGANVAAASSGSCPGGTSPSGECLAPDDFWDDHDLEGSSDDDDDEGSEDDSSSSDDVPDHVNTANPHAHVDEATHPEDNRVSCDEYLDLVGHRTYRESSSFYQEVGWSERVVVDGEGTRGVDVCMTLDDIVQICSSYRPHYHEPFVHFPAAYLGEFRRAAFIGGGDAMLLHEALKYPSVELVLGLELDQKNVRESLRHFRVRPHFDDPRVQWWFGDAAKSLTLLPREWFGTFDLVMVDLSETGMSISVNDDLDIFGALSLLLKPGGIMVKNEDYFTQMSRYFDYSVSVYMDANPMLCDQDWAMGSNRADFLHPKLRNGLFEEHRVETLEYLPLDDEDEHYKMIIDYAHNDARKQGVCDEYDEKGDLKAGGEDPAKPAKSAGILLVVDAEEAAKDLDPVAFEAALKSAGMTPLTSARGRGGGEGEGGVPSLFVGMEEGYVAAHSYTAASSRATGLEILLWARMARQDDVLRSLLDAAGVAEGAYSSYRVIHGGMNGHKHWREEANSMGPVKKNVRNCDAEEPGADDPGEEGSAAHFEAVLKESMSRLLRGRSDKAAAVLCGARGVQGCATLDSLRRNPKVDKVIAIWSCPEDGDDGKESAMEEEEGEEDVSPVEHVYACGERGVGRSAKSEEGYSALVVDPSALADLVEMGHEIFCNDRIVQARGHPFLRDRVVFVTPLSNDAERTAFARCLRRISKRLSRSAVVVADGGAEVGIVVSDDDGFVRRVVAVAENVQETRGVRTEVDRMKSGPVPFQSNFDPVYHSADAYEQMESLMQYARQEPLASQSVYQLEVEGAGKVEGLHRGTAKEILDKVVGGSAQFAKSERAYFEAGDGSVAVALAPAGRVIVAWNGAGLFTLNILTEGEDYERVQHGDEGRMTLVDHKALVDAFQKDLPPAAIVAQEQMPRGAGRVVNFRSDIDAARGCADHYEVCGDLTREVGCAGGESGGWMRKYCSLSCGSCDELARAAG